MQEASNPDRMVGSPDRDSATGSYERLTRVHGSHLRDLGETPVPPGHTITLEQYKRYRNGGDNGPEFVPPLVDSGSVFS